MDFSETNFNELKKMEGRFCDPFKSCCQKINGNQLYECEKIDLIIILITKGNSIT